jgi:hypothetical protein
LSSITSIAWVAERELRRWGRGATSLEREYLLRPENIDAWGFWLREEFALLCELRARERADLLAFWEECQAGGPDREHEYFTMKAEIDKRLAVQSGAIERVKFRLALVKKAKGDQAAIRARDSAEALDRAYRRGWGNAIARIKQLVSGEGLTWEEAIWTANQDPLRGEHVA